MDAFEVCGQDRLEAATVLAPRQALDPLRQPALPDDEHEDDEHEQDDKRGD